jgi:hypothetical protein
MYYKIKREYCTYFGKRDIWGRERGTSRDTGPNGPNFPNLQKRNFRAPASNNNKKTLKRNAVGCCSSSLVHTTRNIEASTYWWLFLICNDGKESEGAICEPSPSIQMGQHPI